MEKIVVFTPSLNIGGIERILLTYAQGLGERGYEVTYLTLNDSGDFSVPSTSSVKFISLGVNRLRKSLFPLIRFLKDVRPDVVFVANDATLMIYLAKLLSGESFKIITSQHNYFDIFEKVGIRQIFVPKYIFPRCFKVIAVSEGVREMLMNTCNLNPNKVVTICNPIDIEEIHKKANSLIEEELPKKYILFVGRFDTVKNIAMLLRSFKLFNDQFSDVSLVLVGGGPEEKRILDLVQELGIYNKVHLVGVKSNPFPYMKKASLVVLSSLSEAFPTVLLESLCLGKTIASTPTMGGKNILCNGSYGYLSNSLENINDFYLTMAKAYKEPFLEEDLRNYCKDSYSLGAKVDEFVNLL